MKKTTTTNIDYYGETCELEVSVRHTTVQDIRNRSSRHSTIHVSLPWNPEHVNYLGITAQPPYSHQGDDKVVDKQWRVYNKAEVSMQKDIIDRVNNIMMTESPLEGFSFSRKAGCSCGCSPGFVKKDYGRKTVYITVHSPRKKAQRDEQFKDLQSKREAETLSSLCI